MSQHSVAASTETLNGAAVANAWRQWGRVGVATSVSPGMSDVMVDPEPLILGSLALAHRERRLADVAEEWLVENADLVSIGRLRALRPMLAGTDADGELSELAARVQARTGSARWRVIVRDGPGVGNTKRDHRRGPSRKAIRVGRWYSGATTLLQLRLGFGLGVKPDVLAVLLGTAPTMLSVRDVAGQTGYTEPAVRQALLDLADASWIESTGERTALFGATLSTWKTVLQLSAKKPPKWRRYTDAFAFVARWNATSTSDSSPEISGDEVYPAVVRVRELWRDHREFFVAIGSKREPTAFGASRPWDACAELLQHLANWFDEKV